MMPHECSKLLRRPPNFSHCNQRPDGPCLGRRVRRLGTQHFLTLTESFRVPLKDEENPRVLRTCVQIGRPHVQGALVFISGLREFLLPTQNSSELQEAIRIIRVIRDPGAQHGLGFCVFPVPAEDGGEAKSRFLIIGMSGEIFAVLPYGLREIPQSFTSLCKREEVLPLTLRTCRCRSGLSRPARRLWCHNSMSRLGGAHCSTERRSQQTNCK